MLVMAVAVDKATKTTWGNNNNRTSAEAMAVAVEEVASTTEVACEVVVALREEVAVTNPAQDFSSRVVVHKILKLLKMVVLLVLTKILKL